MRKKKKNSDFIKRENRKVKRTSGKKYNNNVYELQRNKGKTSKFD